MKIEFKPGKDLTVADTLSRAYIPAKQHDADNEAEYQVHLVMSNLPISEIQLNRFRQETSKDPMLFSVFKKWYGLDGEVERTFLTMILNHTLMFETKSRK